MPTALGGLAKKKLRRIAAWDLQQQTTLLNLFKTNFNPTVFFPELSEPVLSVSHRASNSQRTCLNLAVFRGYTPWVGRAQQVLQPLFKFRTWQERWAAQPSTDINQGEKPFFRDLIFSGNAPNMLPVPAVSSTSSKCRTSTGNVLLRQGPKKFNCSLWAVWDQMGWSHPKKPMELLARPNPAPWNAKHPRDLQHWRRLGEERSKTLNVHSGAHEQNLSAENENCIRIDSQCSWHMLQPLQFCPNPPSTRRFWYMSTHCIVLSALESKNQKNATRRLR